MSELLSNPDLLRERQQDVKPTVSEILAVHIEADVITSKEIAAALHLQGSSTQRMIAGLWDDRFSLVNTMLRRLPRPVADDLITYLIRGTSYAWVPAPAGRDAQQCDVLGRMADMQRDFAALLDLAQHQMNEGIISGQQLAEAISKANAVKRSADDVVSGLQHPMQMAG